MRLPASRPDGAAPAVSRKLSVHHTD